MVHKADSPIAKATGTPRISRPKNEIPENGQCHAGSTSFAAQERDDVLDREQHDQEAGEHERHVAERLGAGSGSGSCSGPPTCRGRAVIGHGERRRA